MTKNRSMKVAIVVIALTLISTCFVGTTFAKYTSSATAEASATVAKWEVSLNGNELAYTNEPIAVNLFDADVLDTDYTTPETDVATDKIAPGTSGYTAFEVVNSSEVNAKFSIDFTKASEVALEYQLVAPGGTFAANGSWTEDIADLTDVPIAKGATATYTLYWRWAIGDGTTDSADTAIGITAQSGTLKATVSAALTIYQVD